MRFSRLPLAALIVAAACGGESPVAPVTNMELASLKPARDPVPTFTLPLSGAGMAAHGDAVYVNGPCVATMLFASGSGDAVLDSRDSVINAKKCPTGARRLVFTWDANTVETVGARINLGAHNGGILSVPDGATVDMPLNIAIDSSSRCTHMKFRYLKIDGTATFGGEDARVSRSGNTWTVTASKAECLRPDGIFEPVTLSVSFTVSI